MCTPHQCRTAEFAIVKKMWIYPNGKKWIFLHTTLSGIIRENNSGKRHMTMESVRSEESFAQTDRTTFKRLPKRGSYDRETVYRILDEAFICHVGFAVNGSPFVIPTGYGRD